MSPTTQDPCVISQAFGLRHHESGAAVVEDYDQLFQSALSYGHTDYWHSCLLLSPSTMLTAKKLRNKLLHRFPQEDAATEASSGRSSPQPVEASSSSKTPQEREKHGLFPLYPIPGSANFDIE
jgi:hypothetical protein